MEHALPVALGVLGTFAIVAAIVRCAISADDAKTRLGTAAWLAGAFASICLVFPLALAVSAIPIR